MKKKLLFFIVVLILVPCFLLAKSRKVISLNGEWYCESGYKDSKPDNWRHKVPVPGLVDLITPKINWKSPKYFWYKKTFFLSSKQEHESAFIKIDQSKYGTEVWLNGENAGYYNGCYTSSEYNITDMIEYDRENILLVRVGQKETLSQKGAVGGDFEKRTFIPGIWGDVSLILTGNVKIKNILVIPDINKKTAKIKISINNLKDIKQVVSVSCMAAEKQSSKKASKKIKKTILLRPGEKKIVKLDVKLFRMKLWSPDSPFLYKMITRVESFGEKLDEIGTVFGMREFKIKGSDFNLNNRRIFLRGGNIAFHRFLSDTKRKDLVWNREWIKKVLIDIPKEHNFNYFRNHLGQMYNSWYDLADTYGMLIQNEWHFWEITGTEDQMKKEFSQWIIDNFNHPSIIIWDVLNEPNEDSKEAKMIKDKVVPVLKKIDPTRPWEYVDFEEDHPYIYSLGPVLNDKKFGFSRSLDDITKSKTPAVLNEFLWFWLDSKGNPSWLTHNVLQRWLGFNSTKAERLQHQAFLGSELVELFRRMRVDGIAPFVYLSIDGHCTANWFLGDIKDLKPKPVLKALKNAFSPFGVSIELWDRHFFINEQRNINVYVFNDDCFPKKGFLKCTIINKNKKVYFKKEMSINIEASGKKIYSVEFKFPDKPGDFYVKAELIPDNKKNTASSEKAAYVFENASPAKQLLKNRIVILDPNNEITKFLKSKKINVVLFNNTILRKNDLLVIGEGGIDDHLYYSRFKEIDKFIGKGNVMLIIEPSYNIKNEVKIKLPQDNFLMIKKKESKTDGGYDSYVFKCPSYKNLSLWESIDDEHLKMFNGGFGGIMVSDYSVVPLKPSFVRAVSGLSLGNSVIMEFSAGKGLIVISRIQTRGRLLSHEKEDSLYSRRIDPVAQRYMLNLLNTYTQKEKVYKEIDDYLKNMQSSGKKVFYSSIQEKQYSGEYACDNNRHTRWSSAYSDYQWIVFNLGEKKKIESISLYWETAYGKEYKIMVSDDMKEWNTVYYEKDGDGGTDKITFNPVETQYVCMFGINRGTGYGYSLWEVEID